MERLLTPQLSIERLNEIKNSNLNNSSLNTRVRGLHLKLVSYFGNTGYDIGYTYKIAKHFSDYEIISAAEYCVRKASQPGRAFVKLFEKKISAQNH